MVRCIGRMVSIIKDNGKMTYNMARPRPTILIWESRDAVLLTILLSRCNSKTNSFEKQPITLNNEFRRRIKRYITAVS